MELIKSGANRSRLSEIIYVALNLAFAGLVLVLTYFFDPPYLAVLVVFLSKWRVFAVRPRFWFANLQTNLVDLFVGLSTVGLIAGASGELGIQVLIATLFAAWLLIVKPRSKRHWVLLQAGISQAVSITALFSLAYLWPSVVSVIIAWLVGYICARHALSAFDEEELTFLSLIWGLVVAELAWVAYHWTIAYTIIGELKIPQIAIILTLLGFIGIKLYENHHANDGQLKLAQLRIPLLFSGLIIIMLLVRFSGLDTSQL